MRSINILQSEQRFKGAPNNDYTVPNEFNQTFRELNEGDRIVDINLATLADNERQSGTAFRPTFKLSYIYDNNIIGLGLYSYFKNNLYYVNPEISLVNNLWSGYPQHYEFDIIRNDTDNTHINYKPKQASKYNWSFYISYPNSSVINENLTYYSGDTQIDWNISDGLPFNVRNYNFNGLNYIQFFTPLKHGLSTNDYVYLSIDYNGKKLFQVSSLGNGTFNSDEYMFNIIDVGYTGGTFNDGVIGTFKKVIDPNNSGETISTYYIRKNKIILTPDQLTVTKVGFEESSFNKKSKYFSTTLTPNGVARVAVKNFTNTYSVTPKDDINIIGLIDNNRLPISELHLTSIFRGYSGIFNNPFNANYGLMRGWDYNINSNNGVNNWWDKLNNKCVETIPLSSYTQTDGANTYTFYYNTYLSSGDTIYGDICEYSKYNQTERVVSEYYHKILFNENVFDSEIDNTTKPRGYYYKVHTPMTIRAYSSSIETGDKLTAGQPDYSYFSEKDQQWRWRDLYTYGFIDSNGVGVDFPFTNFAHYPYSNIIFRLVPEGGNYNTMTTIIQQPTSDDCE